MGKDNVKVDVMMTLVDLGYTFTNDEWDIITNLKVDIISNNRIGGDNRIVISDTPYWTLDELSDIKYKNILMVIAHTLVSQGTIGIKK